MVILFVLCNYAVPLTSLELLNYYLTLTISVYRCFFLNIIQGVE